ncbi:MAG: hypothetical protein MUF34_36370 [Polyangiaceae bacterium]|nr:hypothetical protein [Polyangiaceae bacterium]
MLRELCLFTSEFRGQLATRCVSRGLGGRAPTGVSVRPDRVASRNPRRLSGARHEYLSTADGNRELLIHFGTKEITFDEADYIPFGEQLLKQDRFLAGSATQWATGEPYPWERVKEMLESLLEEGIVEREHAARPAGVNPRYQAVIEQEATRAAPTEPLWWMPDSAEVFEQVAGRPLELGYLETVIPVHRVAHAALDADGRHVGENNVFPYAMRLKIPTEWRACPYPGSRHQDDLPMNVTALQAMAKHWRSMLQTGLEVRAEFVRRYPMPSEGVWALGDLHAFSCAALALPSFELMRGEGPVANGALDPVLSSMFRLIDGVRMVTVFSLFWPEAQLPYDAPMTGQQLLHLTERDTHFLSTHGVCAGPPHMVEEFFATVVDGQPLAKGPAPLGEWARDIPAAVDYGLYGLQLYAVLFTLWVRMGSAYQQVREALQSATALAEPSLEGLRARFEAHWAIVVPGRLHLAEQRAWSEARYEEMFERSQLGLRGHEGRKPTPFVEALTPSPGLLGERARAQLLGVLRASLDAPGAGPTLEAVADALLEYLRVERTVLRAAVAVQRSINELLGRPQPQRALSGGDLAIHHDLRKGTLGGMPYLPDAFREELGLSIENTESSTRLTRGGESIELV